jgi:Response regulator containing a CheY-like receiver domain and an HTH DNA-binding domain
MSEADAQSIALFFYFAFLDDRRAVEASIQALAFCRDRKKKNPELPSSVAIVAATKTVWNRYKNRIARGRPNTSVESGWLIPEGVDLGPWREFQKTASEDELLTVIWSKILRFSDHEISEGLGITQGTIRYRLGRALRKLGSMTHGAGKLNYGSGR